MNKSALPIITAVAVSALVLAGCSSSSQPEVIAYCAQDLDFAVPIFQEFEKATGIKVRAVYDSEAVKTVGLANRLLAERGRPQCDVFWGNEEMRTRQLAAQGVFRETNGWAAFGYRSRRLVFNTNYVASGDLVNAASKRMAAPPSLSEMTNACWSGRVAIAYPQFGTTGVQFHALRQAWGDGRWLQWCRALAGNKPLLVDGNSVVVKMVGQGQAWIGLTDSDDVAAGQAEGLPIAALPLTDEMLLIPNTVAVIRGAPHLAQAQQLFSVLQGRDVVQRLVTTKALEGVSVSDSGAVRGLKVDWDELLQDLDSTTAKLNQIFLR